MKDFDIIRYMSTLTGFDLPSAVLERIALERGLRGVDDYAMLDQRDKDLLLADILFVIYTSPRKPPPLPRSMARGSRAWRRRR